MKYFRGTDGRVVFMVLVWLIIVNVFAVISLNRFNLKGDDSYRWVDNGRYDQGRSWDIVNLHSRWDSNWYLQIARDGYRVNEDDTLSNVVFFPAYPMLVRTLSFLSGTGLILAGWVASCAFLFLACLFLFRIAKEFHPESDPMLSVFLLLIFPTAFFLNAVYTESMFLFLSAASFYYALRRDFLWAGIFGFGAALTRVTGVLLFPSLMFMAFSAGYLRKERFPIITPLFLIPLGTFAFFSYHWWRFGDFLLFFEVESAWGRSFRFNAEHFLLETPAAISNFALDAMFLLFIVAVTILLLRRRLYPYAIYVGGTVFAATSGGTLMSIGRYILVLFPVYLIGASIGNGIGRHTWIVTSTLLLALNIVCFVNWYWAG